VRELKAFRDSTLNPSKEALNMAIDALLNEVWERGEKE
jgi:hypothetical protein